MSIKPLKVALIGAGAISYTYLRTMVQDFDILDVVGCSDLLPERSKSRAETFGIRQMTNEEIFNDPEISIVVNTTYPSSHDLINRAALMAGKHVHCEKMMADGFEMAKETYALAKEKGLRIGCAPDTFLGAAYQTARKLIDDGFIGEPISAHAMVLRGYNAQGPSLPARVGGMFIPGSTIAYDMGGYYIHALIALLGPINRISGFAKGREKYYTHPKNPNYKQRVEVTGSTMMQSALEFASGAFGSLTVMGDSFTSEVPRVEIYGTEGMLICPDPNNYGGDVILVRNGNGREQFRMPYTHGYAEIDRALPTLTGRREAGSHSRRGIGVADMAWAITNGRAHRCSAELGLHAMEVIYGTEKSCNEGIVYQMTTNPGDIAPLPCGFTGSDAEAAFDTK